MANEKLSGLTVKLDVDVSEALTGLKAVQREAKEATKALREFETAHREYDHQYDMFVDEFEDDNKDLTRISTKALSEELERREGITTYKLGGYGTYANMRMVSADGGESIFIEGPAIITVNID